MKKFSFELEDILSVRKFEQQQAEIELGKALSEEKEIQDKMDQLAMQLVRVNKESKGSVDVKVLIEANRFSSFVRAQTETMLEKLTLAKSVTEEKRENLRLCMAKTDALEELKKIKFEEYKKMVQDEEDKETDDIVTSRVSRSL
ncbi:MAG: flagellar export protein FliJ [Treponema sp.]|nr:flagellar export protein FliJ [Treponema sp.]